MAGKKRSGFSNDRKAYCYSACTKNPCDLLLTNTAYQACSPWPQFGGLDNTNSRYTPILGSQYGNLSLLNSFGNFYVINTSPTIDNNGNIYVGVNQIDPNNVTNSLQGYLVSFNSNGSVNWSHQLDISGDSFYQSTPTIGQYGIIYFGSNYGYVYAIYPNGNTRWVKQYATPLSGFTTDGIITTSLIIGNDNNIYFGSNSAYTASGNTTYLSSLFSINSIDGSINWQYSLNTISPNNSSISDSVAIDNNSNIYVVYTQPNGTQSLYLLSLTSSGSLRYSVSLNQSIPGFSVANYISSRPTLSVNNSVVYILTNLYITSGGTGTYCYLQSINTANGTTAISPIQFTTGSTSYSANSLARDLNNNLYFSIVDINSNVVLYSYSTMNNIFNWSYQINAPINGIAYADNTPLIGSDGTIYIGVTLSDGTTYSKSYMYAINSNGTLKWSKLIPSPNGLSYNVIITSPAMNIQGNIIISSNMGNTSLTTYYSGLYSFS